MNNTANQANSTPNSLHDKSSRDMIIKGNLFILVSTIFFGVNVPILKDLIPQWMSGSNAAAFRIFGGAILLWLASAFIKNQKIARRDWLNIVLGGAIGLFAFLYLFCESLRYASPVDVSIVMTTPPIFVIAINILFRHRKITALGLVGVFVGLAGAALVILTQGGHHIHASDPLKGNLLAIGSAVCYAFYLVILEGPSHTYNTITLMRWVFGCAAVVAIPLAFMLPQAPIFHTTQVLPWIYIGFVILFPTFVSYLLVAPAVKMIGSKMVSLYQYLVPVIALIASIIMGLDTFRWVQPVAIVIVIAGMMITNYAQGKQMKSSQLTRNTDRN